MLARLHAWCAWTARPTSITFIWFVECDCLPRDGNGSENHSFNSKGLEGAEFMGVSILVLTRYGRLGASSRLRFLQYLPALEQAGIRFTVQALIDDRMLSSKYADGRYRLPQLFRAYGARILQLFRGRHFDLLWIEKEALPFIPACLERALLWRKPYVLDYDDAIFHNYDQHPNRCVRWLWARRVDGLMRRARLVVAGNEYLAARARQAGAAKVEIVPTVIDLDRYPKPNGSESQSATPRIVWIGSPATVPFLARLSESLRALARQHDFILRVVGGKLGLPGVNVECIEWAETSEVARIAESDIGIMPLRDTLWERGKCGYKLIQYMACGLPVVASPVGVNGEIVRDGSNGFLAQSDEEWTLHLARLLGDPELRFRMGAVGRQRVEAEYCVQVTASRYASLLSCAAQVSRES